MKTDRIVNQAKSFNMFESIVGKTEKDIPEFINKHKNFIETNPAYYGLCIWKPKIILDSLNNINNNDILVYCDAGCYLNNAGINRFEYYLSKLIDEKSICVFNTNDKYIAQHYVKNDAIMHYCPDFNNNLNIYCYAGVIIMKKNEKTMELIKDWLTLCENYNFLDKSPSKIYKDMNHYIGNDIDNGLFNLCLYKHKKCVFKIYPDEINLYINNNQIAYTNSVAHYNEIDWSSLEKIPFQYRRWTPKFGYE